jgi:hypothetical protein
MPILGKITSALLCSTMLGGPIMAAPAGSPLDEGDPIGAESLLLNEIGFAIDATTYDSAGVPYVGAPCGGTVAIKWGDASDSPADAYGNVALDVSNLTQSGTSPKMVHFPDSPYVRWTPHNLCDRSQEFADASWTSTRMTEVDNAAMAPDGTSTAATLTPDGTSGQHFSSNDVITLISGFVYTASAYVKANGYNFAMIGLYDGTADFGAAFDISAGTFEGYRSAGGTELDNSITDVGGGWYRITVTALATNTSGAVQVKVGNTAAQLTGSTNWTGNTTSGIYAWGAQLNRGYTPTPYLVTTTAARIGIPQGYDTAASQYGILVEPAATNLLLQSEDLTTTWTNTNSSESANATTAPNAETTADKLVEASDTGQVHSIDQTSASVTSGTTYVFSCYLKAGERTWARLSGATTRFADNFHADFNLGTGAVGTVGAGATISGIVSIGNGWYRCYIGAACDSTGTNVMSITIGEGDTDVTYNGDGSSGIYVWGAQLEAGSVATSYIPTLGSTATRAEDVITAATSTYPHSATAGTVYCDGKPRSLTAPVSNVFAAWQIDDTGGNERLTFRGEAANPKFIITDGGTDRADIDGGTLVANTRVQATAAWAVNDADFSVDGAASSSDGTVSGLPTVTRMVVGGSHLSSLQWNGFIYRLVYVPRQIETATGDLENWRYNF